MTPAARLASDPTARAPLPARLPKGFVLGDHEVDGWLRDGGMAAIYRAHHTVDERRVALKLQLPSTAHDPVVCARFDREVELMRRSGGSAHVVELFDAGVLDDGRRYLVMEWVDGEDLEELLDFLRNQDQRLPVARACRIGRDVARGLAALHEHAVVHLDLKPANVMIGRGTDEDDVVKLVDFGIAADLREPTTHESTATAAAVMGTSSYMSPQQARGDAPAPTFDVYALGVLLYEALSGSCVPPDGWTPETLPRVETRRRGIPPALAELVRSCMDFDAARRPASAAAVAEAMTEVIDAPEATAAPEPTAAPEASADARKRASSEELPVRSGGTELIALASMSSVASVADTSQARTGGTEVMLTHEEVMLRSGIAIPLRPEVLVAAARQEEAGEELERPRSPRPWSYWVAAAGVLMLGGLGVVWSRAGEDAQASGSELVAEREPPAVEDVSTSEPAKRDGKAPPLPLAARTQEPEVTRPAAPKVVVSHPKKSSKPPSGPSKQACEAMRAEAEAAKKDRAWAKVLQSTTQRSCWASSAQRIARTRLRVAAYAEQGAYDKCVKEGVKSTDHDVLARTAFCKKKLGG